MNHDPLSRAFEARQLLGGHNWPANFISYPQRLCLLEQLRGEEGECVGDLVLGIVRNIQETPKTYETESIDTQDKVVHLHYFGKGVDAWIVERDVGDALEGDGLGQQLQAFGKITTQGQGWKDAEWGYIDVDTLIRLGIEIDLYWTPQTVREIES